MRALSGPARRGIGRSRGLCESRVDSQKVARELKPNDLWGELPECSGSARQLYSYLGCTMIKIKFVNSPPLNAR